MPTVPHLNLPSSPGHGDNFRCFSAEVPTKEKRPKRPYINQFLQRAERLKDKR